MIHLRKVMINKYKVFRTTALMDEDLKLIKKINVQIGKYRKSERDKYLLEIKNILCILSNVMTFDEQLKQQICNTLCAENQHYYYKIIGEFKAKNLPVDNFIDTQYSITNDTTTLGVRL